MDTVADRMVMRPRRRTVGWAFVGASAALVLLALSPVHQQFYGSHLLAALDAGVVMVVSLAMGSAALRAAERGRPGATRPIWLGERGWALPGGPYPVADLAQFLAILVRVVLLIVAPGATPLRALRVMVLSVVTVWLVVLGLRVWRDDPVSRGVAGMYLGIGLIIVVPLTFS